MINFFKHIGTAVYKSLYDVRWIAGQRAGLGRAIGYLSALIFVISLVLVCVTGRTWVAGITGIWQDLLADAPEATFQVASGTLSVSGLEQPYRHEFQREDGSVTLLYVDTVSTSSVPLSGILDEEESVPVVLVTSKKIKIFDDTGTELYTDNIQSLPDMTVQSSQVTDMLNSVSSPRKMFGIFFGIALLVGIIILGSKLLSLLVVAWLVYIVVRADKKAWTYRQIYTVGLYALTIPILVDVLSIVALGTTLPFVHTIVLFVILFGVIYRGGIESKSKELGKDL